MRLRPTLAQWGQIRQARHDFGYVVGVLLGDGSFGKNPNGEDAYVQMNTKDKEFADEFAGALSRVSGGAVSVGTYARGKGEWGLTPKHNVAKGMKYGIPELKNLMEFDNIRNSPREFKFAVISGLFDSEGELGRNNGGKQPYIRFAVCDLQLMELWRDLCAELLGLHASVKGPNMAGEHRDVAQYHLDFCGMEKCSKFFDEIPITIDRKRERWWQFIALSSHLGEEVKPYG